jgi:DNA-binding CsgD family transcriptional regulator
VIRPPLGQPLSPRELQVLGLSAKGLTRVKIAKRLHLSVSTVKFTLANVYAKLGAANVAHAVHLGHKQGIL